MSVVTSDDITRSKPEKKLTVGLKKRQGRSNGTITVRHRGSGARKQYRIIDFKRNRYDVVATVKTIEYDPNRNARIALIQYEDGEKQYMIAPLGIKVDDTVVSSKDKVDIKIGNRMPLERIPAGTGVYNIELEPGRGGILARAAGTLATLQGVEGKHAQLKMPSGEVRLVKKECAATIGQVSNPDHRLVRWGKAGRMRHRGIRPTVRGTVMNPVDHPHGGGEGAQPIGLKYPKTPWGRPALGVPTRKKKKASSKLIIKSRKKRK